MVTSRPDITQAVTAGVLRHCQDMDYAPLTEFPLKNDVAPMCWRWISREVCLLEVKSSKADYETDANAALFGVLVIFLQPLHYFPKDLDLLECGPDFGRSTRLAPTPLTIASPPRLPPAGADTARVAAYAAGRLFQII